MAASVVLSGYDSSGSSSQNDAIRNGSRSNVSNVSSAPVPLLDDSPVYKNWGTTQVKVVKFEFTWTIINFSFIREEADGRLRSPIFTAGSKNELVWQMEAFPKGTEESNMKYLSLCLRLISCDCKNGVVAKYQCSILNTTGEKLFRAVCRKGKKFVPKSDKDGWGFSKFLRLDLLNDENGFLPEDTLTIFCQGSATVDRVDISGRPSEYQMGISECTLSENLASLLENQEFSDITLSVGSKDLLAHKIILAARSPVFATMFKCEMVENKQNRVVITDIKYEVLKEMLTYIYTGKSRNIETMAEDLLAAANKYDLSELKNKCETALCSALTVDNAMDLFVLADMHCAKKLKAQAIRYIYIHKKNIIFTPSWKKMSSTHPHVIIEIFEASVSQSLPALS